MHLSKLLHGWRQFVGEVRILLAITADKRVQAIIAVVWFLYLVSWLPPQMLRMG